MATRQAWRGRRRKRSGAHARGNGAADEQRSRRYGWSGGRQASTVLPQGDWRKARGAPHRRWKARGPGSLRGPEHASGAAPCQGSCTGGSRERASTGGRGRRRAIATRMGIPTAMTALWRARLTVQEEVRRQDPWGLGSSLPDAGSHGRSGKENSTKGHAAALCRSARRATTMRH